jgi:hypothetical protein
MRVKGEQAEPMVDDHRVAVDAQIADEGDDAMIRRFGRVMFGDREIVA